MQYVWPRKWFTTSLQNRQRLVRCDYRDCNDVSCTNFVTKDE